MSSQQANNPHFFNPPRNPWEQERPLYTCFGNGSQMRRYRDSLLARDGGNGKESVEQRTAESTEGDGNTDGDLQADNSRKVDRGAIAAPVDGTTRSVLRLRAGGAAPPHAPVVSSPLNPNRQQQTQQQPQVKADASQPRRPQTPQVQFLPPESEHERSLQELIQEALRDFTISQHKGFLQPKDSALQESLKKLYRKFSLTEENRVREFREKQDRLKENQRELMMSQVMVPLGGHYPATMYVNRVSRSVWPLGQLNTALALGKQVPNHKEGSARSGAYQQQRPIGAEMAKGSSSPANRRSSQITGGRGNLFRPNYSSDRYVQAGPSNFLGPNFSPTNQQHNNNNDQPPSAYGNKLLSDTSIHDQNQFYNTGSVNITRTVLSLIRAKMDNNSEDNGTKDLRSIPACVDPLQHTFTTSAGTRSAMVRICGRHPDGSPDWDNSMILTPAEASVMIDHLSQFRAELQGLPPGARADVTDLFTTDHPPPDTPPQAQSTLQLIQPTPSTTLVIADGGNKIPVDIEHDQYLQHKAVGHTLENILQYSIKTNLKYCPAGYYIVMQAGMTEEEVTQDRQRRNSTDSTVSVLEEKEENGCRSIFKLKWKGKGVPPSKRLARKENESVVNTGNEKQQQEGLEEQKAQLDGQASSECSPTNLKGKGKAKATTEKDEVAKNPSTKPSSTRSPKHEAVGAGTTATPTTHKPTITIEDVLNELIAQATLEEKEEQIARNALLEKQQLITTLLRDLETFQTEFTPYMTTLQSEEVTLYILSIKSYHDNLSITDFLPNQHTNSEEDFLLEFDSDAAMKIAREMLVVRGKELREIRKVRKKKERRERNQKEWEEQVKYVKPELVEGGLVVKVPDGIRRTRSRKE